MRYVIVDRVWEPKNPTVKYKLTVTFDDGEDIELLYSEDEIESMDEIKLVYEEYMKRLRGDWNTWCNPDDDQIAGLFAEYDIEIEPSDVWAWSDEYHSPTMARADSVNVTFYDESGVEWNTKREIT